MVVISLAMLVVAIFGVVKIAEVSVNLKEVRTSRIILEDPEGNPVDCISNNGSDTIWGGRCPER